MTSVQPVGGRTSGSPPSGPSPARQIITDCWQRGGRVFVEGIIEGIPDGGTFFSTAQITQEGEIARYVAFYSATRIPACR